MSRLEYDKLILDKVSFCQYLFKKELRKALNHLAREEANELHHWCRKNFTFDGLNLLDDKVNFRLGKVKIT
ncbi:MAG: hypothetical protein RIG77_21855 [Cyclobacteriaceae bacterium]